jgi:hypothetical protein
LSPAEKIGFEGIRAAPARSHQFAPTR